MKIILYTILFLSILASTQPCQKSRDSNSKQIVIDTTLTSGTEYQLNLQSYGDEDDVATIKEQAQNFTISEITNSQGRFAPVYHYAPAAMTKTPITDQVILAVTEGHNGNGNNCRHHGDSTLITIHFTVK